MANGLDLARREQVGRRHDREARPSSTPRPPAGFWSVEVDRGWEQPDIDPSETSVTAMMTMTTTDVDVTPCARYDGGYLEL